LFSLSGDTDQLSQYVFNAFDKNNDNYIDFVEAVISLNFLFEKDLVSMLKIEFAVYDLNGDGKINKREMTRIIDAFYDKRGINIEMRKDIKKEIDKMAKQEMRYFDKNGDDQIDMNEFIDGCVANLALYSPINIILNEMATNFFNISE
jgi:Ca2+-binding EF-hand superfamily protein